MSRAHQNRIDLKEHVKDEKILKSGHLNVHGAMKREEQIEQIEQIDNLVKRHPIKQLHSEEFRVEQRNTNEISLNPYLVGITYMRRLDKIDEMDKIASIILTEDIKSIVGELMKQSWDTKLAGTIFTADQGDLQAVIDRLKDNGAHKIGTEKSDFPERQGAWNHVSGGSLTFAINCAKENNEAHDSASKNHMYAITGYLSRVRFTITAQNYSDLRWITSCVVDKLERIIEKKETLVILGTDKEARINSVLFNLATSLASGTYLHASYIKYGKHANKVNSKYDNLTAFLGGQKAKKKKDKLSKLYTNYDFVIALPGHLIIDNGIKKNLECMTFPLNHKLAEQANVPEEDKWQYTNIEIYRPVRRVFPVFPLLPFFPPDSKNDLYEFGRQVCSYLDHELNRNENRATDDKKIPEE